MRYNVVRIGADVSALLCVFLWPVTKVLDRFSDVLEGGGYVIGKVN